jgi:hypothetical protein
MLTETIEEHELHINNLLLENNLCYVIKCTKCNYEWAIRGIESNGGINKCLAKGCPNKCGGDIFIYSIVIEKDLLPPDMNANLFWEMYQDGLVKLQFTEIYDAAHER